MKLCQIYGCEVVIDLFKTKKVITCNKSCNKVMSIFLIVAGDLITGAGGGEMTMVLKRPR